MDSHAEAAFNGFFSTPHVMTNRSREGEVRLVKRDENAMPAAFDARPANSLV